MAQSCTLADCGLCMVQPSRASSEMSFREIARTLDDFTTRCDRTAEAAESGIPLRVSMARLDTHELGAEMRNAIVPLLLRALRRLSHEIQEASLDEAAQVDQCALGQTVACRCSRASLKRWCPDKDAHAQSGAIVWKDSLLARYRRVCHALSRLVSAAGSSDAH